MMRFHLPFAIPKKAPGYFGPYLLLGCMVMGLLSACSAGPVSIPAPEPQQDQTTSLPALPPEQSTAGTATQEDTPPEGLEIDGYLSIIVALPLSGDDAALGQSLLNAITLALYDFGPSPLRLTPIDTASDIVTLERALPAIIAAKPAAIIGPVDARLTRFLAQAIDPAIPLFSLSDDPSAAAPNRYIFGIPVETEVRHIVAHAVKRGAAQFAGLTPLGPYGDRVNKALGTALQESGGTLAQSERYPRLADSVYDPVKALTRYDARKKDLDDEIRFLRSLNDDVTDEIAATLAQREELEAVPYTAVLLAEGGSLLRTLSPLLPFYEVDQQDAAFLGTGLFNDESLKSEPTLEGARFPAPAPALSLDFKTRFEKLFSYPASSKDLVAYDAAAFVFKLILEHSDKESDRTAIIESPKGYQGITGLFRFHGSGRIERALAILEITPKGLVEVEAALTSFPQFGNALSGVFPPPAD